MRFFGNVYVRSMMVVALSAVLHTEGAVRYDYHIESSGDPLNPVESGVAYVGEDSFLIEPDESLVASLFFSTDDNSGLIAIHHPTRTWYESQPRPDSYLLRLPPSLSPPDRVDIKAVNVTKDQIERLDGMEVTRWSLQLSFATRIRLGVENIRTSFFVVADIWTTEALQVGAVPFDPRILTTGFNDVDAAIRDEMMKIGGGFPLQRILKVRRKTGDGITLEDVVKTRFSYPEDSSLPREKMSVPEGYVNRMPQIGWVTGERDGSF